MLRLAGMRFGGVVPVRRDWVRGAQDEECAVVLSRISLSVADNKVEVGGSRAIWRIIFVKCETKTSHR